jgi:alpha-1,2-mannosyltransferase
VSLGIAAVGTAVAVLYARSDDWLGVTAVCGITMLLTSPVSWTHHWVWAIPALGLLLRARRLVAMALLTVIYPIMIAAPMWSTPHFGGPAEYGLHGLTSITANCFLLAGLALFVYLTTIAPGVSLTERTNLRLRLRPAAGQT